MVRIKAKGKWISGLDANTSMVEAARQYLSVRLSSAVEILPAAAQSSIKDVEYVHQLRVATRRSDAALVSFRPCVRQKTFKKMRKRLRRIRDAARNARCCDVHTEIFSRYLADSDALEREVLKFILKTIKRERSSAQETVVAASERYPEDQLRQRVDKLIQKLRQPADNPRATLLDAARDTLPKTIQRVNEAANENLKILTNLHRLRLCGKKLRYAMELFAPCYEPELRRDYYPIVEQMQEHLGQINDSREIIHRLEDMVERMSGNDLKSDDELTKQDLRQGLLDLVQLFQQERDRQRVTFLQWWGDQHVSSSWDQLNALTREA